MKPRSELKQPKRKAWLARGTKPIPKVNAERRAKKAKRYSAHLKSASFRALRLLAFARDGWQCVEIIDGVRCQFVDESRTGHGLIADHTSYARFGHELLEDLQTRCRSCDRRCTPLERANHAQGFRRG